MFRLGLKLGLVSTIVFYIIVNPFLYQVKSGSVIRSGEYRVFRSVLNTSGKNAIMNVRKVFYLLRGNHICFYAVI